MKRKKFADSQIAMVLGQVDKGTSVDEVCRKISICQQTYYRWRKKYGGVIPSEMIRMKQLEEENKNLKNLDPNLLSSAQCSHLISFSFEDQWAFPP
ncbi:MAG: hypothetical protein COB36_14705 [Alphaproteobacteria bacterium]|nr:MAG: hypothetical protein COB36_14705 [Alphaproteobacteria bacterium]